MRFTTYALLPANAQPAFREEFCRYYCQAAPISHSHQIGWSAPAASREFWLCTQGEHTKGRVAAFVSSSQPGCGYIGFLDADHLSVAEALIQEAYDWLKNQGIHHIYGPINGSTWYSYRFSTDPLPQPRLKALAPPYAPLLTEAFLNCHFSVNSSYHTTAFHGSYVPVATRWLQRSYDKAINSGWCFESISNEQYRDLLPRFYQIALECFKNAPLFEPIAAEEFYHLYQPLQQLALEPFSVVMRDTDGAVQGFILAFALERILIIKSVAVMPSTNTVMRRWSPSQALLYCCLQAGITAQVEQVIAALLHEEAGSNILVNQQSAGIVWKQNHVLYGRTT